MPRPIKKHADGLETWKARDGWRWRTWSKGRITAESGEGYKRRQTMMKSANRVSGIIAAALINEAN